MNKKQLKKLFYEDLDKDCEKLKEIFDYGINEIIEKKLNKIKNKYMKRAKKEGLIK